MRIQILATSLLFALQISSAVGSRTPVDARKLRVLFIGNSYTHINDLPKLTAVLAASAKPPRVLETEFVGEGGATLKRHWEAGRALEAIRKGLWDYVILQDQGTLGPSEDFRSISDPQMFHTYARKFDAEIRKTGAKTLFFMTWARQDSPRAQTLLTNAYARIAEELKANVAPVGIAWQRALAERPNLILHDADRSHPAFAGSYLAACVIYASLFSSSPEGLSRASLSEADAAYLQRIAWQSAKDPQQAIAEARRESTAEKTDSAEQSSERVVASAEAVERGRAIFAAAQKAAGGSERLLGIKDVSVSFSAKLRTPMGEMAVDGRETVIFPNVVRSEMKLPFGDVISFYDGTSGWRTTPQGVQDMPERVKNVFRAQTVRNTLNLLRGEGEFAVYFEKRDKLGASEADVIVIEKSEGTVRLFIEPSSGTLLKKTFVGMGMGGPAEMEELYSDYRDVSGLRLPYRIETTQNGAPFLDATVTEVKLDGGIDLLRLAQKPEAKKSEVE